MRMRDRYGVLSLACASVYVCVRMFSARSVMMMMREVITAVKNTIILNNHHHHFPLSRMSLASLIFAVMYADPPLSR